MLKRKEIKNALNDDLFSLQVYDPTYFEAFDPNSPFEKWAAVEVPHFDLVPDNMESFLLKGGTYAIFLHKGAAAKGRETFQYIFGTWLPNSGFILDKRPHFEILGAKYKNDDPSSEEEVWIPVKKI